MDLASNILQVKIKFPNLGPLCCMTRPKMKRNSWTLKGRLKYILTRRLLKKKIIIIKKNNNNNEIKKEKIPKVLNEL